MAINTGTQLLDSVTSYFGPGQSATETALVTNSLCDVKYTAFVGAAIANTNANPLRIPLDFAVPVQFRVPAGYVKFVPNAAYTANDTNYTTLSLVYNNGNGGSDTTIASYTGNVAGGSMTAGIGINVTVNSAVVIPAGQQLEFKVGGAGTTPTLPQGTVIVHGRWV